jgi:hypothetical protein
LAPKKHEFEHDAKLDVGPSPPGSPVGSKRGRGSGESARSKRKPTSARRTRRCAAQDLKAVFKLRREKTARALAEEFIELHGKRFPKAAGVFEAVIGGALSYPEPPTAGSIKVDPYAIIGG